MIWTDVKTGASNFKRLGTSTFINAFILIIIAFSHLPDTANAQTNFLNEYSTDNRLLSNVKTALILENGLVVHQWKWNDLAASLSPKYGALQNKGGYPPVGLIAQDVQAKYPDAVFNGENGFLIIDLPVLMERDELIGNMVLSGEASTIAGNFLAEEFLLDCFTTDC